MRTIRPSSILALAVSALAACGGQTFSGIEPAGDGGPAPQDASVNDASRIDAGSCALPVPYCPWNGCLDGPQATCGADLQWHCPAPPPKGCSDAGPPDANPPATPVNHRPNDAACKTIPPAGGCGFSGGGPGTSCSADDDCTGGVNGRCGYGFGGVPQCVCSYDTCAGDSECPSDETCACHGSPYFGNGNGCVQGNCRVDSDCGVNGYCSPAVDPNSCGSLLGYYCHTPKDECVDDKECSGTTGLGACTFAPSTKRWECKSVGVCASPGGAP